MKLLIATSNPGKFAEFDNVLQLPRVQLLSLKDFPTLEPFDETGVSFLENARGKAAHFHGLTGMPVVADDSGLEVDVLGGAPGIHSARYAGSNASDRDRIERLLQEIRAAAQERAAAASPRGPDAFSPEMETAGPSRWSAASDLNEIRSLTAEEKFKRLESFEIGQVALPEMPGYEVLSPARFVCALSYCNKATEQFFAEEECPGFIVSTPRGTGGFGYDPVFLLPGRSKTMAELTRAEKNEISHRGKALGRLRQFLQSIAD